MAPSFLKTWHPAAGISAGIGFGLQLSVWIKRPVGYDAVESLFQEGRRLYPGITFKKAALPLSEEVRDRFDNIFFETVIMHLPVNEISRATQRLKSLVKGVIYLSWRVTENQDLRDPKGRLYSAFEPQFVLDHFVKNEVLHFEDKISKSSGKRVSRLIAKTAP